MSARERPCSALVLAGSRRGAADPVASHAGVRHKSLVPVGGTPMLARVILTLRAWRPDQPIVISLEDDSLLHQVPEIGGLVAAGEVRASPGDATPGASVLRAIETMPAPFPLLVTTSDHPLLTPAMLEHFCAAAPKDADLVAAAAPGSIIRREHPEAVRTYFRFSDDDYSGCNLYLLRTGSALRVVRFWSDLERHRKRPWRLLAAIGPATLLRYLFGRLSLDAALERLSTITGARVRVVRMPFAEAAVDVDKPADLALAEAILRRRGPA